MTVNPAVRQTGVSRLFIGVVLGLLAASVGAEAPIVQPGAPGQPSRQISADEAIALASIRFSAADVKFMQDMSPHHQQALDMSVLVAERTSRNEMIELARKIESSQRDEIAFMEDWLRERGEALPDPHAHHAHHAHHEHHTMQGMATPEQMAELAAASGEAFDTLFLQLMIKHHQGALVMVEELLEESGSAQEPVLFEFTTAITNDQEAEIERMAEMLAGYSPDPRVGLAAGFQDAGEALLNMELVASLPKPPGFFDPENPAALPMSRLRALNDVEEGVEQYDAEIAKAAEEGEAHEFEDARDAKAAKEEDESRPALLDFANTDLAFLDDILVAGNYHGFNIYDIGNGGVPELASSVVCPGGQGDVSVVGNLLIMSVEQQRGRLDCGLTGVAGKVSEERFRGLRIFDISDITMPVQVGAVQTCRGSHTHTIVAGPDEDRRLIVYNSGTSRVREEDEMEGCVDESPWRDERTALFRIDVIEIPVDRPAESRIIHSPTVFADPETGIAAGLWERGDHGPDTQTTSETNHCHDITVFPELGIAAGACSGNGILFDISDPINPTRIDEVVDSGFAYWHSATFNNDGDKVIFTDEWGGGSRARCRASDPMTWGANAIYDIVDGKLVFRSYFKMPAPQTEQENCVAHNGSLVPVPGRDIMVQAWYQGGISVFDFTDSAEPFEIAFFDRGPIDEEALVTGGFWSAYWYRGMVYATEIVRGLDVLSLSPSEFLSENELRAAALADKGTAFNPQQQYLVSWPNETVVARAYQDQLMRANQLSDEHARALSALLERVDERHDEDVGLGDELEAFAAEMAETARGENGAVRARLLRLAELLEEV